LQKEAVSFTGHLILTHIVCVYRPSIQTEAGIRRCEHGTIHAT